MRYILMANIDGKAMSTVSAAEGEALTQRYIDFTRALAEAGVLRGAEQLERADTATTVRRREGDTALTDGPFADVTESFGGFWIVEAPDLDTALAHADKCPAVEVGSVEVRALIELG